MTALILPRGHVYSSGANPQKQQLRDHQLEEFGVVTGVQQLPEHQVEEQAWYVLVHPRVGVGIADEFGHTINTLPTESAETPFAAGWGVQSFTVGLLEFASSAVFDLTTPDMTLEFWYASNSNSDSYFTFYDSLNNEVFEVRVDWDSAGLYVGAVLLVSGTFALDTGFRHFAVDVYPNGVDYTFKLRLNGVETLSATGAAFAPVGAMRFSVNIVTDSKVAELAFTPGGHKHDADFTPGTEPYEPRPAYA